MFDAQRSGFGFESPVVGATNDWWTPPELVRRLGHFDLDPCAGVGQPPLATQVYAPPQDGLSLPWKGRVFCNPPYGPGVIKWAIRMAQHGDGILLIFARVETRAWQHIWRNASGILFPFKRITFLRPDGTKAKSGTAPSAFVAYGSHNGKRLHQAGIAGAIVQVTQICSGGIAMRGLDALKRGWVGEPE